MNKNLFYNDDKKTNSSDSSEIASEVSKSSKALVDAAIKTAEHHRRLVAKFRDGFQSQIAAFIDRNNVFKQYEKMVNPLADLEKSLRLTYADKISSLYGSYEKMCIAPFTEAVNSLRYTWLDRVEQLNLQMKDMLKDPLDDFRTAFQSKNIGSLLATQQQMEKIARGPYEQIRKALESSSYTRQLSDFKLGLRKLNDFAVTLPKFDFVVTAENTVLYRDTSYDMDDIQALIEDTISKYKEPSLDEKTFLEGINRLITEIKKNKNPLIQQIIIGIIYPIIVGFIISFFTPVIDEIRDHLWVMDKRSAVKTVQRTIEKTEIPKDFLSDYRFVIADVLHVRSENNQKSMIMGKLYFGQIVRMVQKKKGWTLIEFQDKNGEFSIKGWVFTRYVKKFKN